MLSVLKRRKACFLKLTLEVIKPELDSLESLQSFVENVDAKVNV